MAEDDLGNFFEEIEKLEEVPSVAVEVPPVVFSQVISKMAQIIEPSHTFSDSTNAETATNNTNTVLSSFPSSGFSTSYTTTSTVSVPQVPRQSKEFVRCGGGTIWKDDSLNEWPENDYRIFVGDLAKEITTEMLAKSFQHYTSFARAKVVRSKIENRARGYGFVSFMDPMDCAKAIREMNGKYLGSRPMKITKSSWKDRDIKEVKAKEKKKRKIQQSLGLS